MILNAYYYALRELLASANPDKRITHIGFGLGSAPAMATDSQLTDPYRKPLDRLEIVPGTVRTLRCHYRLAAHEAVGLWITEMGLYTADGTLIARAVRSPIEKTADLEIGDHWDIQV